MIRPLIGMVILARRIMTAILELVDQRTTTISRRASSVAHAQRMTRHGGSVDGCADDIRSVDACAIILTDCDALSDLCE